MIDLYKYDWYCMQRAVDALHELSFFNRVKQQIQNSHFNPSYTAVLVLTIHNGFHTQNATGTSRPTEAVGPRTGNGYE